MFWLPTFSVTFLPKIIKIGSCTWQLQKPCVWTFLRHSIALLNAFSALTLLVGWQEGHPACKKTEWWCAGVVICLERGADLHTASCYHCHSPSLASVKSRLVLPFWYRPTQVVPDKGPLNVCSSSSIALLMCQMLLLPNQTAPKVLFLKKNNNLHHHFTAIIQVNLH